MAEHSCDLVAAWTFDIHEIAVRTLHQSLELASSLLFLKRRSKEIFCQRHRLKANRIRTSTLE